MEVVPIMMSTVLFYPDYSFTLFLSFYYLIFHSLISHFHRLLRILSYIFPLQRLTPSLHPSVYLPPFSLLPFLTHSFYLPLLLRIPFTNIHRTPSASEPEPPMKLLITRKPILRPLRHPTTLQMEILKTFQLE